MLQYPFASAQMPPDIRVVGDRGVDTDQSRHREQNRKHNRLGNPVGFPRRFRRSRGRLQPRLRLQRSRILFFR